MAGRRIILTALALGACAITAGLLLAPSPAPEQTGIQIGSKAFTESHILAELSALLLEAEGHPVIRRLGLGGTMVAFEALREGAIDLYPEYSGTLAQAVLQQPDLDRDQLATALEQQQLQLLAPFGFNNSYAIAVSGPVAAAAGLRQLSDLAGEEQLKLGFSLEFLHREDGWPALQRHYELPQRAVGIEHALAYRAIANGQLHVTDAYTTDGELAEFDLVLLADDKQFFGHYEAALLARQDLPQEIVEVLSQLSGSIDAATMRALNRRVSADNLSPSRVAADFLLQEGLIEPRSAGAAGVANTRGSRTQRILHNIKIHLQLTVIALFMACIVAIPLALAAARYRRLSQVLLYTAALVQTVPSLALLALLIPLLGLGKVPAIVALFLYSLLPIVRNTLTGIFDVDPLLSKVAAGMGLTAGQRLRRIELPLALPTILAGIKTAAIISIGTATLAAFVGAGGLGEPIITGLTLNDHTLILEGAIPAALLAVVAELIFEGLERTLIPIQWRQ